MSARYLLRLSRDAQPLSPELDRMSGGQWLTIADDITLFTSAKGRVVLLPEGRGIVFGHIFHRYGPAEALEEFAAPEIGPIEASGGLHLFERYWGRYLGVVMNRTGIAGGQFS